MYIVRTMLQPVEKPLLIRLKYCCPIKPRLVVADIIHDYDYIG